MYRFLLISCLFGCNPGFKEYCEEWADCVDGNDEDQRACVQWNVAEKKTARIYECTEEYLDFQECWKEEASCSGDGDDKYMSAEDDCDNEWEDYQKCLDKASDVGD